MDGDGDNVVHIIDRCDAQQDEQERLFTHKRRARIESKELKMVEL